MRKKRPAEDHTYADPKALEEFGQWLRALRESVQLTHAEASARTQPPDKKPRTEAKRLSRKKKAAAEAAERLAQVVTALAQEPERFRERLEHARAAAGHLRRRSPQARRVAARREAQVKEMQRRVKQLQKEHRLLTDTATQLLLREDKIEHGKIRKKLRETYRDLEDTRRSAETVKFRALRARRKAQRCAEGLREAVASEKLWKGKYLDTVKRLNRARRDADVAAERLAKLKRELMSLPLETAPHLAEEQSLYLPVSERSWKSIEKGERYLTETTVESLVRSVSPPDGFDTTMSEARAILDPECAFRQSLVRVQRAYGIDFRPFSAEEQKLIAQFRMLPVVARRNFVLFLNSAFDLDFTPQVTAVGVTPRVIVRLSGLNKRRREHMSVTTAHMREFGDWLAARRAEMGLSQAKAAELTAWDEDFAQEGSSVVMMEEETRNAAAGGTFGKAVSVRTWERIESGEIELREKASLSEGAGGLKKFKREEKSKEALLLEGVIKVISWAVSRTQQEKVGKKFVKLVWTPTPGAFERNMEVARSILDPAGAVAAAEERIRQNPEAKHPLRVFGAIQYLSFLRLSPAEQLIVESLFSLRTPEYCEPIRQTTFDGIFSGAVPDRLRRIILIHYLNLAVGFGDVQPRTGAG
jgi:hypothetical protein